MLCGLLTFAFLFLSLSLSQDFHCDCELAAHRGAAGDPVRSCLWCHGTRLSNRRPGNGLHLQRRPEGGRQTRVLPLPPLPGLPPESAVHFNLYPLQFPVTHTHTLPDRVLKLNSFSTRRRRCQTFSNFCSGCVTCTSTRSHLNQLGDNSAGLSLRPANSAAFWLNKGCFLSRPVGTCFPPNTPPPI